MKVKCDAPLCDKEFEETKENTFKVQGVMNMFEPKQHYCPEHLERITAGIISDGDPSTNPDLPN